MKAIRHEQTTMVLGRPTNWDDAAYGPCETLPIVQADGLMYSYWSPTWRERLRMLVGVPLRLCVASSYHPPVAIEVERT